MPRRAMVLPALWVVTLAAMIASALNDPSDPKRRGLDLYGHNAEGALRLGLLLSLTEFIVLLLALCPWEPASWGRGTFTLVAMTPCVLFAGFLTMHAGGIMAIHFLWLLACWGLTFATTAWAIVGSLRRAPRR